MHEQDGNEGTLHGLYEGPVSDNADPLKQGRVRVRLPGIADDGTAWARPYWPGAGGKQRGTFAPPPIGAEVGVMFKQGDPDQPRYFGGFPGEGEVPMEVAAGSDPTKVFKHETDRWFVIMDDSPGLQRVALQDKKTGDMIEIDGVNAGVHIKATAAMSIEVVGTLDITAAAVTVNGRKVSPSSKAI